jgi:uncharacterized C2H2 Zn-finger protein
MAKAKAKLGRKKLTVSLEKMKVPTTSTTKPPTSASALTLKVKFPHAAVLEQQVRRASLPEAGNYCRACERSFSTAGSLRRHVKNFHNGVVVVPKHRDGSGVEDTDSEYEGGGRPQKRQRGRPPKSPPAKGVKRKRSRTSMSSSAEEAAMASPARPKAESDLTCPTCDRTFPAKSIFERHMKTAHQQSSLSSSSTPLASPLASPFFFASSSSSAPLPHLNSVVQPTMEVGGVTVNKYECHLCNKVFLRVKDLAKHRDKACSAWM